MFIGGREVRSDFETMLIMPFLPVFFSDSAFLQPFARERERGGGSSSIVK